MIHHHFTFFISSFSHLINLILPLSLLIQVPCLRNGAATTFYLGDLRGKFVLLLFQPVDFGYIGPTELELLDDLGSDCEVLHHIDFNTVHLEISQLLQSPPLLLGGGDHLRVCGWEAGIPHHSQVLLCNGGVSQGR